MPASRGDNADACMFTKQKLEMMTFIGTIKPAVQRGRKEVLGFSPNFGLGS